MYNIYGCKPITGYELVNVCISEADMLIDLHIRLDLDDEYTKYTVVEKSEEKGDSVYGVYHKDRDKEKPKVLTL